MLSDEEDTLIDYLEETYGCHTFILYGSRAQGTHHPDSDWDIVALNRGYDRQSCHVMLEGVGELNAYIYPDEWAQFNPRQPSLLYRSAEEFVRLRDGRVLIEELNWGTNIIQTAKKIYEQGPPPFPDSERAQMAHHLEQNLLEAAFNEKRDPAWRSLAASRILVFCFRLYFQGRNRWVPSGRDGFDHIRTEDPSTYALFRACDEQPRRKEAFATLIRAVLP